MAEKQETQPKAVSSAKKMVPEADLLAVKAKFEKLEKDNAELKGRNLRLEKRLEIVDLKDVDDEDLKNVKELFLSREAELDEREAGIKEREESVETLEASHKEREKEATIQTLASKYKLDAKLLKDSEDPEKEAFRLVAESLNKEEKSPEDVIETLPSGGKFKKQPKDMDEKEFSDYEKDLKAGYYEKK